MVNAAKAVSARQRAREASLKFYEREKERERVQLRYFQAMESVGRVYAQRDREVVAVHARAERAVSGAIADADAAIVTLLELKVSRAEIQERLDCSASDIRRAETTSSVEQPATPIALAPVDVDPEPIGEATADVHVDVPAPAEGTSSRAAGAVLMDA